MIKKLLCFLGGALLVLNVRGQEIKPLTLGETVPNITLNKIINYNTASAKLSDFKAKLVILDFWATWCGSCIEALPHLQDMKEHFGKDLQVITVTAEKEKKIQSFLSGHLYRQKPFSFPFVTEDTQIHRLFNAGKYYPLEIWIDGGGVVIAKTDTRSVTKANIEAALGGRSLAAVDTILTIEKNYSIADSGFFSTRNHAAVGYSGFGSYSAWEVGKGFYCKTDSRRTRFGYINSGLVSMLANVFQLPQPVYIKQCLLYVRDTGKFYDDWVSKNDWNRNNSYCYEAMLPFPASRGEMQNKILSDLCFYFGINASVKQRTVSCLVLKRTKHTYAPANEKEYPYFSFRQNAQRDYVYEQANEPLSFLAYTLNTSPHLYGLPLVVNEAGSERADLLLTIGKHPADTAEWNLALRKYGLALVPEKRSLAMLEIRENNTHSSN